MAEAIETSWIARAISDISDIIDDNRETTNSFPVKEFDVIVTDVDE